MMGWRWFLTGGGRGAEVVGEGVVEDGDVGRKYIDRRTAQPRHENNKTVSKFSFTKSVFPFVPLTPILHYLLRLSPLKSG